ncbi:hypothetical protein Q8A67_022929 [Cirrhinus molitorella]|uniref:Uncharacterized protein n=1 Tax=Cirrhinus molitorella TaxID=172907 RepID=A0AA88TCL2_9TELE|nr:hypothetical protein Q8A67_022929 [Cirrhinus molitorella]
MCVWWRRKAFRSDSSSKTLEEQLKEGTILCVHNQPTAGEIKTPVQCVENNKGSGGVIIHDWETFTMSKQHLVAACDHTDDSYYNSTACPVMAKEAVSEFFTCSVKTKEVISEFTACPIVVKEAIPKLSACPVMAKEAVPERGYCRDLIL